MKHTPLSLPVNRSIIKKTCYIGALLFMLLPKPGIAQDKGSRPSSAVAFSAIQSTSVTPSNFTETTVTGFSTIFDEGNPFKSFTPGTGTYKIPSDGIYHFDVYLYWNYNGVLNNVPVSIRIKRNGRYTLGQVTSKLQFDTSYGETQTLSVTAQLTAGDAITVTALYARAGASLIVFGNGGTGSGSFSGFKVQ